MTLPNTPETNALAVQVMERVTARMRRREGPPARSIARTKDEFPKLLCLDQMKWIDLGRAHYGQRGGEPFVPALTSIRRAIDLGRVMVPIMPSNLLEAAEHHDEARRQRLAQFMVDLSGNHSFAKPDPVADLEMDRAIRTLYLGQEVGAFPRESLVQWGLDGPLAAQALGNNPALVQMVLEPEWSVMALVHAIDRDGVARGRQMDERAAAAARAARIGGFRTDRYEEELRGLFADGSFAQRLYAQAAILGIERVRFEGWLDDNRRRFASAVPEVDIRLRLLLARDRNEQHPTHQNDLKDFIFLKLALPYGNIAVTENSWTHLARSQGMDKQYRTAIIADLRELPDLLARECCLS
jgi:hypothetical protein